MNRCTLYLKAGHGWRRWLVLASFALVGLNGLLAGPASAQGVARQFPAAARRGFLEITLPPEILINGQLERLSPGARIRGINNLLVLSASLAGQRLLVNFVRDPQGQISDVWLLNDAEAQEQRPGLDPVTNFVFESDANKPKTDDGKTPFDQLPTFPAQ